MKGPGKYRHVLAAFYGTPWAILQDSLREIEAILWKRIEQGANAGSEWKRGDKPDAAFDDGAIRTDDGYKVVGSAAVVPIHGPIFPRADLLNEISGATTAEATGRAVDAAAADTRVEQIVLDIDSPGGSVFGIPETGAKILAARKQKPVTAIANHMAASAAYWFATQANTIAVTPAGWVGSVGVIWSHTDWSKYEEQVGRSTTYITAGLYKAEGAPEFPLTPEARNWMQQTVNSYYQQFIGAVAKGRGTSTARVEKDFGQGRVVLPADAIEAGMADRIATLETIVNEINGAKTSRTKRRVAADLAAAGLPTA